MATLTSHTLNGTDGTHAGEIPVTLTNLTTSTVTFTAQMDEGGRLSENIDAKDIDPDAMYELVFDTARYWAARNMPAAVTQIATALCHDRPRRRYHMPIILNPNSYSMWTSR